MIIFILILTLSASVSAAGDWAFRRSITIDHARVVGDLTNFPVLIDIIIDSSHAQAGGQDIYFTLSDGTTKLNHEIESYNSGHLIVWVNVPLLSNSSDTVLYMYYGNPSANNQANATAVWDSGYLAVHHLEETSGIITDSTGKNNGSATGGVTQAVLGKVDGGDQFDGIDDKTILPQIFSGTTPFTFELWINASNKQGYAISQWDTSYQGAFIQYQGNGGVQMYVNNVPIGKTTTLNTWHYIVGTYDGTTARVYIDGGSPVSKVASLNWPNQPLYIGDRYAGQRAYQGKLDEIRISNTARTEAYIQTNYNNQNNPQSFIFLGTEEILTSQPVILNEKPQNGKTDVVTTSINVLSFDLFDPQGGLMNYSVTTSPNIGSDSANGVLSGTYTVPISNLDPYVTYTWNVTAIGSTGSTFKTFTFTTIPPISQVTFSDAHPNNINATYNPKLSINIGSQSVNDLTVIFETNSSSTWETIATQTGKNGVFTQKTSNMDAKGQKYYWRVRVFDGSSWKTSDVYSFIGYPFLLKWRYSTGATTTVGPLAADVNGDGVYEVFTSGKGKITCFDGASGRVIWSYASTAMNTEHVPFEIGDLNNDGIPELVASVGQNTVAFHANNGSIYWTSSVGPYADNDKYSVIVDTEGRGYPYVYTATADVDRGTNGTGRIRKLRGTDGAVMAEAFSWRPCYGGLSAADANNDGKFEIYMGDRSVYYHPPSLGKGVQAYDADNLSLLWYHDEVLCSSHAPALTDINNDKVLDAVVLQQSGGGIYTIDGATGEKMPGKWADELGLSTHSQFSIWDIDNDNSPELITCDTNVAKVWDMGSWKLDATLDYFREPPKMADVIGDEKLEIIGGNANTIKIYNGSYQMIENITGVPTPASSNTIVQDIDNDGQNELIEMSYGGTISVYDTSAYAPTPRVRTNNQYYSERRLGVGIYIPPPGAPQPFIKNEYPVDGSSSVELSPTLSFNAVDFHYDRMNIEISTDASGQWEIVKTFSNVTNGRYNYTPVNMNKEDTEYHWMVSVSDPGADNMTTTKTFTFTTKIPPAWPMPGWNYRKKITIDRTKVVGSNTDFPVLINVTDSDLRDKALSNGNDILFTASDGITKLNHEIESYDPTTGHLVAWVKVPVVPASQDTVLYLYYGNSGAENQQNPTGVWDANYLAVHHLEEISGAVEDSTSNNNDGVPSGGINQDVAGKIDGSDQLDGVNDKITLPQVFTDQNQFTIEFWMNTANKQGYAVSQWDANTGVFIQHYRNGSVQMYLNGNSVSRTTTLNAWHHVVGTYDGTTARLYIDGSSTARTIPFNQIARNMIIGDRFTGSRAFQGMLDEVRISNTARNDNYIRTSYNNQNNPGTFLTLGAEETSTSEPLVLNENPVNRATDVPRNLSEISFDLFDNQNDPMNYSVITSPNIGSGNQTGVLNGRYSVPVSGLQSGITYNWTITVNAGSDTKVKNFEFTVINTYDLTTSTAGGGFMNVSSLPPYAAGTSVNLTATPDPGKEFLGWIGDLNGSNNPETIIMNSDKNIRALFRDPGSLIVDSEFDHSIDDNTLRANSTFQDWYESRNNVPTLLTMDNTDVGGNTGNKAKLIGSSSGNAYLTQEFRNPQTGNFSVQWDIYVDSIIDISTTDYAGLMFVGDDINHVPQGPNYGSGQNFVWMAFFKDGGGTNGTMDLRATNRTGGFVTIAPGLNLKQWYTIRVDCNLNTDTYDVYINRELKASNVSSRTAKNALTHITFAQWNDGAGEFYVDNVYSPIPAGNSSGCTSNADCSANNLPEIADCRNIPEDTNPYTWDARPTFTSQCINGTCTVGNLAVIHTCDVARCYAECDALNPCALGKNCLPDCTCA